MNHLDIGKKRVISRRLEVDTDFAIHLHVLYTQSEGRKEFHKVKNV